MAIVEETALPGVGVRYEFLTEAGERVGMIVHRTGRRELLVYDRDDPDSCRAVLRLGDDDAHILVDLLGGSAVAERLDARLRQSLEGVTLEWVEIVAGSPAAGLTLAELGLRTATGASVVAVLRGDETVSSPPARFRFAVGDTAVLVGSPGAIDAGARALRGG